MVSRHITRNEYKSSDFKNMQAYIQIYGLKLNILLIFFTYLPIQILVYSHLTYFHDIIVDKAQHCLENHCSTYILQVTSIIDRTALL